MVYAIKKRSTEPSQYYTRGGSTPYFGPEAHLYRTQGMAQGMMNRYPRQFADCEVVALELREVQEGSDDDV